MMKCFKHTGILLLGALIFASCQKELSLVQGTSIGTLKSDGADDCLPALINGTYAKDTLLKADNYVDVQVEVSTGGAYDIRTDTLNGYSFAGTGNFTDTGLQTVRLKGTGRPISGGVDVFTVKYGTDSCQINIVVSGTGGGGGGGGSTACGNTATDYVLATIAGNCTLMNSGALAILDQTTLPGYTFVAITGENAAGDTSIRFGVGVPGSTVPPGSYNVNATTYIAGGFLTVPSDDYAAQFGQTNPTPVFTITISSISATRVRGTYTGALYDNMGAGPGIIQITSGAFDVPF